MAELIRSPVSRPSRPATASVLAVLATAGLYEHSGQWLYDVGLPGKSGVAGGIVTVSPGKGGLGTFSPPLDAAGNSVRGQHITRYLSEALGLNLFASAPFYLTTPEGNPASGAAGLRDSSGDESRRGSQSVSRHAINRTRGEHRDRYLHLRRLFQPRRLRRRQRQLDRLLGQARPRAARPPPRPVPAGAADGLRGQHVPGVRADGCREHREVRGA